MARGQSRERLRGSFAELLRTEAGGIELLAAEAEADQYMLEALQHELERIRDTARYLGVPLVEQGAIQALHASHEGGWSRAVANLTRTCRSLPGLETVFRPVVLVSPRSAARVSGVRDDYAAVLRLAETLEVGLAHAAETMPSAFVVDHELLPLLVDQLDDRLRNVALYAIGPVGHASARILAAHLGVAAWFSEPIRIDAILARIRAEVNESEPPPYRVLVIDPDAGRWAEIEAALGDPSRELRRIRDGAGVAEQLDTFLPEVVVTSTEAGSVGGSDVADMVRGHERIADTPVILLADDESLEHTGLVASVDDTLIWPFAPESLRRRVEARLQRARATRRARAVDPLTGAIGRGALLHAADREVRLARRYEAPLAVVMVDVDGMRRLNVERGSEAGDTLLRAVAQHLIGALRETDLVGRLGGDSFGLLMSRCSTADAFRRVEALRAPLAAWGDEHGYPNLRFSAGIADTTAGLTDVLARADDALHVARREGGGRTTAV